MSFAPVVTDFHDGLVVVVVVVARYECGFHHTTRGNEQQFHALGGIGTLCHGFGVFVVVLVPRVAGYHLGVVDGGLGRRAVFCGH